MQMTRDQVKLSDGLPPTHQQVMACLERAVAGHLGEEQGPAEAMLRTTGVIDSQGITSKGRKLYHGLLIDCRDATEIWPAVVSEWRPFKVVLDVFAGRAEVNLQQIQHLWKLHGLLGWASENQSVRAATLGGKLGVWRYHRQRRTLEVPAAARGGNPPTTIHPDTPYGNQRAIETCVTACKGQIMWLDKHFSRRGLDLLHECVDGSRVQRIRVLVGDGEQTGSKFWRAVSRLRDELGCRGVQIEIRILNQDDQRMVHDRWLGDGDLWYNVPPLNSIFQGQHGEILKSRFAAFDDFWKRSFTPNNPT